MTRLDAVNVCLASIGEAPVNSLEHAPVDAIMAAKMVDGQSIKLQNQGWHWNRETQVIEPDVNGELLLPANLIKIREIERWSGTDLVQRGLRLFDRLKNTYKIDRKVAVDLYIYLPFEDLVPAAKQVVAYGAAISFQEATLGSGVLDTFIKDHYMTAMVDLMRAENYAGKPNMLRDNLSTAYILDRGNFSRGQFR